MAILKQIDFEVPEFGEFATAPLAVPGYADAVRGLDPIAYWRLDEQAGTTLADQTSGHLLTLEGNYALNQTGALTTDPGSAIRLNSAVAATSGAVLPNGSGAEFSLVFWIKLPSAVTTGGALIRQFDTAATGHFRLVLLGSGKLRYVTIGDSILDSSAALTDQWQMIVLTRSLTGTTRWYFDGQPDSEATGHTTAIHDTAFRIGAIGANVPDVLLDEVAVFDFALSPDQARWLHGLGKGQLSLAPSA